VSGLVLFSPRFVTYDVAMSIPLTEPTEPEREPEANKLFRLASKLRASGFDLEVDSAPLMRLGGVTKATNLRPLSRQDLERLLSPLLFAEQRRRLDQGEHVTFAYTCEEGSVYRVNVSGKGGQLRLSAHRVEGRLPTS
jgi:Tfp pilus assembly pilus retraction ATPase PilT